MARKIIQVSSQYTNNNGEKKWRNCTVGSAFTYDDGNISLSLDPGVSIVGGIEGVKITIKDPLPPRTGL